MANFLKEEQQRRQEFVGNINIGVCDITKECKDNGKADNDEETKDESHDEETKDESHDEETKDEGIADEWDEDEGNEEDIGDAWEDDDINWGEIDQNAIIRGMSEKSKSAHFRTLIYVHVL